MNNLNKQTKIMIGVVLSLILVIGGSGIALYAQDQSNKEELRQQVLIAYHEMNVPQSDKYDNEELDIYNRLMTQREQAFVDSDLETLKGLSEQFEDLQKKVSDRLKKEEDERKAKEEEERKEREEAEAKAQAEAEAQKARETRQTSQSTTSSRASSSYQGGVSSNQSTSSGNSAGSSSGGSSWENDVPDWSKQGQGGGCKGSSCSNGWSGWS